MPSATSAPTASPVAGYLSCVGHTFEASALEGPDAESGTGAAAEVLRAFITEYPTYPTFAGDEVPLPTSGWRELSALPNEVTFGVADPSATEFLSVLTVVRLDSGAWTMDTFNSDCGPLFEVTGVEEQPVVEIGSGPALDPPLPPFLACDGLTFPSGAIIGTSPARPAVGDIADALSAVVREPSAWHVLVSVPGRVVYGSIDQTSKPWQLRHVTVEATPEGWQATDPDGVCDLRAVPGPDLNVASWTLDETPTSADRSLRVLVMEEACASGRTAEGRIEPPLLFLDKDRVIVTIGVRPAGGGQDCPGHGSAPYTVELGQALGDRVLLDGGVYPPLNVRAGAG